MKTLNPGEVITLIIFAIICTIVAAYYMGNWLYNFQQRIKQKKEFQANLRFKEKYIYLKYLLRKPVNDRNYNEFIQNFNDLECNTDLENAMKDDLNNRFKFVYSSYIIDVDKLCD